MNSPQIRASLAGLRNQWGTSRAFQQAGFKKKLNGPITTISVVVVSIFLVITIMLQGEKDKTLINSTITSANIDGNSQALTLKTGGLIAGGPDSGVTNNSTDKSKSKKLKQDRAQTTLGPVIIMPENFGTIPPGTFIKAKLVTGASNGPVKAEIEEPIYINGDLVAPIGATAMGVGSSTEERLNIGFSKIILKGGEKLKLRAQAYDFKDQIVGLKGTRISGKALQVAGGIGLGFLGGLSEGLQDQGQVNGVPVNPPTLKNAMLNGTATASLEESKQLLNAMREKKVVIEVPAQTDFFILVQEPPDQDGNGQ